MSRQYVMIRTHSLLSVTSFLVSWKPVSNASTFVPKSNILLGMSDFNSINIVIMSLANFLVHGHCVINYSEGQRSLEWTHCLEAICLETISEYQPKSLTPSYNKEITKGNVYNNPS